MSRTTLRRLVAVPAAAAMLATGLFALPSTAGPAPGGTIHPAFAAADSDPTRDGQELFRGLIFGQGPVADALHAEGLRPVNAQFSAAADNPDAVAAVDAALAEIDADDPEFFAGLSADLRSGDPHRVQRGLESARELVTSATQDRGAGDGQCITFALAFTFAIYVYSVNEFYLVSERAVADQNAMMYIQPMEIGTVEWERAIAQYTLALAD